MTLAEAYRILGVESGTSFADVKAAYRHLVLQAHPDQGGDKNDFIRVQAAYELICAARNEFVDPDEVPVPDELRSIIDAIVRGFRMQRDSAEERAVAALDALHAEMANYVGSGSRGDLRRFGEVFNQKWNAVIRSLFTEFNDECNELLAEYDDWFFSATGDTLGFRSRRAVSIVKRKRSKYTEPWWLLFFGLLLFVFSVLVRIPMPYLARALLFFLPIIVVNLYYWRSTRSFHTARGGKRFERMNVDIFRRDSEQEFLGSAALRLGRRDTATSGVGGFILGDLLSEGIGGPIVGAFLGTVLGGIAERINYPTSRIRQLLLYELDEFMDVARQAVPNHILMAHDEALRELKDLVEKNFQGRVWEGAKLLTSGSRETDGRSRGTQSEQMKGPGSGDEAGSSPPSRCPHCQKPLRAGVAFCPQCGHEVVAATAGGSNRRREKRAVYRRRRMVAAGSAALLALGVGLGVYFGTSNTGESRSTQGPQTSQLPGTTQVTSATKTAALTQADLDYVVALGDGSYRVTTIFQDLNGATQIMSAMGVMSQLDTLVSLCDALVEEYAIASALKPTPLLSEVHEHYVGGMEHFRDGAQLLRESYVAGDYSLVQQANDEMTAGFAEWSQATPLLNELGMQNLSFGGAGDIPAVAVPDVQPASVSATTSLSADDSGYFDWRFTAGDAVVSSPVVSDGTVYFGSTDGCVYAVDARSGREKWRFTTGDAVVSSPVVSDGTVYFGSTDGCVYAVNEKSGKETWKFATHNIVTSSPTVSDGVVYFGSSDSRGYAASAKSGQKIWEFETGGMYLCDPVVSGGVLYIGSHDCYLYAVDSTGGREKWRFMAMNPVFDVVVSGGLVYCRNGFEIVAVDRATGEGVWTIGPGGAGSMVVSDGTAYFCGEGYIFALDAQSGREEWRYAIAEASSPVVFDGVVYFGSGDSLLAVDSATGQEFWRSAAVEAHVAPPVVHDGMVYFGASNGTVYAVAAPAHTAPLETTTTTTGSEDGSLSVADFGGKYEGIAVIVATQWGTGSSWDPDNPMGYATGQTIEVRVVSGTCYFNGAHGAGEVVEAIQSGGGDVCIVGKPEVGDIVGFRRDGLAQVWERIQ